MRIKMFRVSAVVAIGALLAGCSGGSQNIAPIIASKTSAPILKSPVPTASPIAVTSATAVANARFTLRIPRSRPANSATKRHASPIARVRKSSVSVSGNRKPNYIADDTASVTVSMTAPNGNQIQSAPQTLSVDPDSPSCKGTGDITDYVCTLSFAEPVGTDSLLIVASNDDGHPISQQQLTTDVEPGAAVLSITLDAIPYTFAMQPSAGIALSGNCESSATDGYSPGGAQTEIDSNPDPNGVGSCSARYTAENQQDFIITLSDTDGTAINPQTTTADGSSTIANPGFPKIAITNSNPTAFSYTYTQSTGNIAITALGLGYGTIVVTETSASATDGITATASATLYVSAGDLYVADASGVEVFQPYPNATPMSTIAIANGSPTSLTFDAVGPAANLYVSQNQGGQVDVFAPTSGVYSTQTRSIGGFGDASDVKVVGGNLVVSDGAHDDIAIVAGPPPFADYSPSSSNEFFSPGTPAGMAFDASGDLFVTDSQNGNVDEYANPFFPFAQSYGESPIVYGGGTLSSPAALAFDAKGDLFVAESGNATIGEFTAGNFAAGATQIIPNPQMQASDPPGSIYQPTGLCTDSSGDLYVVNGGPGGDVALYGYHAVGGNQNGPIYGWSEEIQLQGLNGAGGCVTH